MITFIDYSGNENKVKEYLIKLDIDYDNKNVDITVKNGRWTLGAFGRKFSDTNKIESYAPKWTFFFKDYANAKIIQHEYAHFLGIKECESFFLKRIFCLMYEGWWSFEIFCLPLQLITGLNFCNNCKEKYEKLKKEKNDKEK